MLEHSSVFVAGNGLLISVDGEEQCLTFLTVTSHHFISAPLHGTLTNTIVRVIMLYTGDCDIDQIDAGPGGVSMEQFQRLYVQQRFVSI